MSAPHVNPVLGAFTESLTEYTAFDTIAARRRIAQAVIDNGKPIF
jgi:hypothetical protein